MSAMDVVAKIQEIICTMYDDPADQIIKEGEALKRVGEALKGKSWTEARAVILALKTLLEVSPARNMSDERGGE